MGKIVFYPYLKWIHWIKVLCVDCHGCGGFKFMLETFLKKIDIAYGYQFSTFKITARWG